MLILWSWQHALSNEWFAISVQHTVDEKSGICWEECILEHHTWSLGDNCGNNKWTTCALYMMRKHVAPPTGQVESSTKKSCGNRMASAWRECCQYIRNSENGDGQSAQFIFRRYTSISYWIHRTKWTTKLKWQGNTAIKTLYTLGRHTERCDIWARETSPPI